MLEHCEAQYVFIKGPFYTGNFCCDFMRDFVAISNRPCKLLAIQIAVELSVVYTGDLKSRLKSPLKSPA